MFNPPFADNACVATVTVVFDGVTKGVFDVLSLDKVALLREALRGDLWSACSSHLEYDDVWVAPTQLSAAGDALEVTAKVRIDPASKEDTVVSALSLYLANRAGCFSGALSVMRLEMPTANPSLRHDSARVNDRPVGDRPVRMEQPPPPPPRSAYDTPQPEPAHHAMLSPSREAHMRTYVNTSHIENHHDVDWYNRPRKTRPDGGFRVDDLLLGRLPDMTRYGHGGERADPRDRHSAEYQYFQDHVQMRVASRRAPERSIQDHSRGARHPDDYSDVEPVSSRHHHHRGYEYAHQGHGHRRPRDDYRDDYRDVPAPRDSKYSYAYDEPRHSQRGRPVAAAGDERGQRYTVVDEPRPRASSRGASRARYAAADAEEPAYTYRTRSSSRGASRR